MKSNEFLKHCFFLMSPIIEVEVCMKPGFGEIIIRLSLHLIPPSAQLKIFKRNSQLEGAYLIKSRL